jgi:hypothetical protein
LLTAAWTRAHAVSLSWRVRPGKRRVRPDGGRAAAG